MKKFKIEELNLPNKKGIGWIALLGWIPIINFFYMVFLWIIQMRGRVKINKTPYLLINGKKFGNAKLWGIIYTTITLLYISILIIYTKNLLAITQMDILGVIIFIILPVFGITLFLFDYQKTYKFYTKQVDSFIEKMIVETNNSSSKTIIDVGNMRIKSMMDDLKNNKIIEVEQSEIQDKVLVSFTPEFQQQISNASN